MNNVLTFFIKNSLNSKYKKNQTSDIKVILKSPTEVSQSIINHFSSLRKYQIYFFILLMMWNWQVFYEIASGKLTLGGMRMVSKTKSCIEKYNIWLR